jgi:hypothetical protein
MTSRIEIDILLPPLASKHKKGKRSKSLIVVIVVVFILIAGTTLGIIIVHFHGHPIGSGKRGKGITIKRGHRKGELVKLIDTHPIGEAPLDAYEHVLALMSVMTPSKHALKHPKDTTGGGARIAGWRRSSCARTSRPRRS